MPSAEPSACSKFSFSSGRRHTSWPRDWSSDVCSSDLRASAASPPRGVLAAEALCAASPRVAVVVLGTSDLAKELRVPHSPDRIGLLASLGHCVLAARAHGLDIIDGVHLDLQDSAGLEASCRQGRELGFDGKSLIHPGQIAAANAAFSPAADELEHALAIETAWQQARARGEAVVVVAGRLVENLHVAEARRLLALAAAIRQREAAIS